MKKLLCVWMTAVLSLQIGGAFAPCAASADDAQETAFFTVTPAELTMTEGEVCRLQIAVDPAFSENTAIQVQSARNHVLISPDGTVTGYESGEDTVLIHAFYPDAQAPNGTRYAMQTVKVLVDPNEALPEESLAELERLRNIPFCDFQRKRTELLGALDENAPRITKAQAQTIIESAETPEEMFRQINAVHQYPDLIFTGSGSDVTWSEFWLDAAGTEKIRFAAVHLNLSDEYGVYYSRILADGTVIADEMLYPDNPQFEAVSGLSDQTDLPYIRFHQLASDSGLVPGDIDENGVFNSADAVTLQKHLLQADSLPDTAIWDWADMNHDNRINAVDLTLMKRALADKRKGNE